jgi:hypothetical protein
MPWIVPKTRLGDQQQQVLNALLRGGESHWIRGFAGSGKSIILIHSLNEALARNPGATACVVVYTHALKDMLKSGLNDELRQRVPVMTYHQFRSSPKRYDFVFADEVQDMPKAIVSLLRRNAGRLIVAGDEVQSIYEDGLSPQELQTAITPAVHQLNVIYRLTEKLKQIVSAILPNANLSGAQMGRMTGEVEVTLGHAQDAFSESKWVWQQARLYSKVGAPSAILFAKHDNIVSFLIDLSRIENIAWPGFPFRRGRIDYGMVNDWLESNRIPLRYLGNDFGSFDESDRQPLTYLMTYHSSKGLDFENVFLPGLKSGMKIGGPEHLNRAVFYVATTRSRRNLFLTYHGPSAHEFVTAMPSALLKRIDCKPMEAIANDQDDNLF